MTTYGNIITKEVSYLTTVCRTVCVLSRTRLGPYGAQQNISEFLIYRWKVLLPQVSFLSPEKYRASLLGYLNAFWTEN